MNLKDMSLHSCFEQEKDLLRNTQIELKESPRHLTTHDYSIDVLQQHAYQKSFDILYQLERVAWHDQVHGRRR